MPVVHLSPPEELLGSTAGSEPSPDGACFEGYAGEDDTLRFHHVLIRDVAYSAITKESRADLHERYGSWLEKRNEPDELVGYHAEQSHRYRASSIRAIPRSIGLRRGQASGSRRPESARGSGPIRRRQ